MTEAARWLARRLEDAPPSLRETMLAALPEEDGGSVADSLAAGALSLYERLLRAGTGGREDALPLLAADALMTHALEAQAEADPDGMAEFARRWGGAGKLGELAGTTANS